MPSKKKTVTSAKRSTKTKAGKAAAPVKPTKKNAEQKNNRQASKKTRSSAAKGGSHSVKKTKTVAESAPKKRVGIVRKVAGGLVAGALKGVASVVEKVAGIDEGPVEARVSREVAQVREEVTAAKADLSQEIAVVREEVEDVHQEVAEVSGDLQQVTKATTEARTKDV